MKRCDSEVALARLDKDTSYLCHNDLTRGNLMTDGNNLMAIDWEYAAMGSRYFDVAIACESLSENERNTMMNQVFDDKLDEVLMKSGRNIAGLMTALWQSCFALSDAPAPTDWARRTRS